MLDSSDKMESLGRKIILPCFVFVFLFVSIVEAQELNLDGTTVTAPYGAFYDLKRTCSNNGTYCSTATSCNVTIVRPDGTLLANNRLMTNNLAYYNATLNQTDNRWLGRGIGTLTCTDPSGNIKGNGYATFNYVVTGDGNDYRDVPHQLIILAIGLILIFVGKLREDFAIVQNLGSMIVIIMGVLTIYPGYSFFNYSSLMGLGIGATSLGLGLYFLLERALSREREVKHYDNSDDGRYHDND